MGKNNLKPKGLLCTYAAGVLYERYCELKGAEAAEICREFEIIVRASAKLKPTGGSLCFPTKEREYYLLEVSAKAELNELKDFVIYHELAHFFLDVGGVPIPKNSSLEYWEQEAWCDNFAFAMLLFRFGHSLVGDANYEKFFRSGEELVGADKRDGDIGIRLLVYCEVAELVYSSGELPPLFRLAQEFLKK